MIKINCKNFEKDSSSCALNIYSSIEFSYLSTLITKPKLKVAEMLSHQKQAAEVKSPYSDPLD